MADKKRKDKEMHQTMETQESDQDLEFVDMDLEVREFVRRNASAREQRSRERSMDSWSVILFLGVGILTIIGIVWGILWGQASVAVAVLVMVLELLLALCLCRSPIWLHVLVVVGNVLLGLVFHLTGFMILAAVLYVVGIAALYLWRNMA